MRLHLPKTLLAALLACFAALPEYASGAATIVTFGNAGGITGVTTDAFYFHNTEKALETLSDGSFLTIAPSAGRLYSGSSDGAIKGTWSNTNALNAMNTTLGFSEGSGISAGTLSAGSTSYYTASGNGGSTSTLTLQLSADVLVGSEVTFFVTATARTGNLGNFSAAGLQSGSTAYAENDGTGFSDSASFSDDSAGSLTLIKYTGTVGVDKTVAFNSTTGKNGWQMLAYNVTGASSVSYLTWNGTDAAYTWNTSDTNWRDTGGQASSFTEGAYVRFTSDAANKTAVIDSAVTAGTIDVLDDYTFTFGGNASLTFDGLFISAGKTLTKAGAGTWALGDKTIVGNFKLAEGSVTSSGAFNGDVAVAGGTLTSSGAFNGDVAVAGGTLTSSGAFNGDVAVEGGTLTSSGTFNGNVSVIGGVVELGAAASINGNLTIDGGDVTYTTTSEAANNKFGGNVSVEKGTLTINAVQNNGTSIIKAGSTINIGEAGKIVLKGHDLLSWNDTDQTGAPASINMEGAAGEGNKAVLQIINPDRVFTMSSALDLNGYTEVTGDSFNTYGCGISASGEQNIISSGIRVRNDVTITVSDSSSLEIQGNLQVHVGNGSGSITKAGAGTLTISGTGNTYGRGIAVTGGKLNIDSDMSVSAISVTNGSSLNTSEDIRITTLSVDGASTVNASADMSVSTVSLTGGSNLTVGAGTTTTITTNATNGGFVLNPEGTSKVILKGQSETVAAGGKLVYDDFTYQASGATDAEIIGNKATAFKLWDSFGSISNATVSLNSDASGVKTIGDGGVGTLNNVTLSNNSTHNLTVSSTATGKLSIINNDGGASASGTGTIIDKTIKNTATTRAEGASSTPSFSSYDRVEAVTGDVEIYKVGAQVNVADMVIGAGRTISVYQGDDTSTKSTVVLGGLAADMTTLTAGSGSTLDANLLMYHTELILSGALTLNGSLEMYSMKLMATDYMHWNNIGKDGVLTLFNGVTGVTGFTDGADASTVFTNLGTGDFTLKYNAAGGIVQMVANRAVPEPTTATLSLLALAGLMARRRRRRA